MRLDQALVKQGFCESRTEAQEIIKKGGVFVDDVVIKKQTKEITNEMVLRVEEGRKYVSRGGTKLEGIMNHIYGDDSNARSILANQNALDIGSSTGGFTDYLLQHGVAHVTAVDVGTKQLHHTLQNNENVTLFENTDIRNFTTEERFDSVVADLSFIPLDNVFEKIISFGKPNSSFFLLIKPQFEVGKGNTKKGIVKDTSLLEAIFTNYKEKGKECNLTQTAIVPCSIQGGDGNQEYFLYGKKK